MGIKMAKRKYLKGYKFKSNEGYECEVIEEFPDSIRKVMILDGNNYSKLVSIRTINNNSIENPYHPTIFGRGFIGVGDYNSTNSKINNKDFYDTWNKMFNRCYKGKDLIYKNVTVCKEWYNFQNFMEYVVETFPFEHKDIKFTLDKDLLQLGFEHKVYSPSTTVWLPQRINSYIQIRQIDEKDYFRGIWKSKYSHIIYSIDFDKPQQLVYLGSALDFEEAKNIYIKHKLAQDEKARQYLLSLNYLPEEIIQLVRTV